MFQNEIQIIFFQPCRQHQRRHPQPANAAHSWSAYAKNTGSALSSAASEISKADVCLTLAQPGFLKITRFAHSSARSVLRNISSKPHTEEVCRRASRRGSAQSDRLCPPGRAVRLRQSSAVSLPHRNSSPTGNAAPASHRRGVFTRFRPAEGSPSTSSCG